MSIDGTEKAELGSRLSYLVATGATVFALTVLAFVVERYWLGGIGVIGLVAAGVGARRALLDLRKQQDAPGFE